VQTGFASSPAKERNASQRKGDRTRHARCEGREGKGRGRKGTEGKSVNTKHEKERSGHMTTRQQAHKQTQRERERETATHTERETDRQTARQTR
jgi:hypothetical protein